PSTTSGNPVFYFNGTINGNPTNISAGVNDYYMYTSDSLDGNGVYNFMGEFRTTTCSSNCPNTLKIYIKDYRQYSLAPTIVDSSIITGYYSYATPAGGPSGYSIQFFDSLYNGTAASYLWYFGDSGTSVQDRPIHTYWHPGIYHASLNTVSTTSCFSSLNNDVIFGQVGGLVEISFGGTTKGDTVNLATTSGGGVTPYSFNWNYGDGNNTTTVTPTTTYTYTAPGIYLITLTRTDAVDTIQVCRRHFPIQPVTSCYNNFFPTTITPVANPTNLADVIIEWHDAGGNLYTSANNGQSIKSMFKISSIADYQNNTSGQPTKIIHAKVACTLYNGTTSIPFSGDLVFAVAYL
ncbi:MAG TPA: PKD domain-containing protein, partial [Bacteroidia bacterium]|nr:PKD domain-containing protein [Bacteroidia bacterium]